jgi:SAM-dependent methyltransferase
MKTNIAYKSDQLARYFSTHRVTWDQFYESERAVIEQLQLAERHEILDIGCGCGGLGLALRERFGVERYTGVEINQLAVEAGRVMSPGLHILCGDILDLSQNALRGNCYDVVFSLSCVDWNTRFSDMLATAWGHVLPGGYLVATFRLALGAGCDDMESSYQFINYFGEREGERAAYVVLNAKALVRLLDSFNPAAISAFGYWGMPSATAVTPYDKLCFSAFSIQKRVNADVVAPRIKLELPADVLNFIGC